MACHLLGGGRADTAGRGARKAFPHSRRERLMEACLIGLDLGSSAVKAGAFTPVGRMLAAASVEYPTSAPRPDWKEQDPERWWRAACSAIREMLAGLGG